MSTPAWRACAAPAFCFQALHGRHLCDCGVQRNQSGHTPAHSIPTLRCCIPAPAPQDEEETQDEVLGICPLREHCNRDPGGHLRGPTNPFEGATRILHLCPESAMPQHTLGRPECIAQPGE